MVEDFSTHSQHWINNLDEINKKTVDLNTRDQVYLRDIL